MAAGMPGQECHFAAFEFAADVGVRRCAEWGLQAYFFCPCESWHGIEAAAADDSYFRFCQSSSESRRAR